MRRDTFVGHLNCLVPSLEHGFVPTTIGLLARERGVAIQTIYNSVDNRPEIPSRIFDQVASWDIAVVLARWFTDVNVPHSQGLHRSGRGISSRGRLASGPRQPTHWTPSGGTCRPAGTRWAATETFEEGVSALIWSAGKTLTYHFLVTVLSWKTERYRGWSYTRLLSSFP